MADVAQQELYAQLAELETPAWWFAGEQDDLPPTVSGEWQVFSNRSDTAKLFEQQGYAVELGDFSLFGSPPKSICYRVSKEKALVHYLINQAATHLEEGGVLLLVGYKNDGLKTYADKAARLLAGDSRVEKRAGGVYVAHIYKGSVLGEFLPDQDYEVLRPIAEAPRFYSKPGIFGWQKLDQGSALLIQNLDRFLEHFASPPQSCVDLGCGYGYLAVMAHQRLPDANWLLTDNNATALVAAEGNCRYHGIEAQFLLADCAEGETGQYDALFCNPPFHQGFAVEGELTDRFIKAAYSLLRPGGQALFVVNQFIPLQRKAQGIFADTELLLRRDGFCVIRLSKA
jgi:16S rRNA (guanine1207-N2)-methyltransferase